MNGKQEISINTATFLRALVILIFVGLVFLIWDILLLFFVAMLLSALIIPFADWGLKRKIPRGLSVLFIYIIALGIVFGLAALLVPPIISQSFQIINNFGAYQDKIISSFSAFKDLGIQYGIWDNLVKILPSALGGGVSTAQKVVGTVFNFLGGIGSAVLVLVMTFYIVVEEDNFKKLFSHFIPLDYQSYFGQMWFKVKEKMGFWLRGQLFLDFIIGAMSYIGLLILDVQYALLLGVLAGIFETIPYAGPIFTAVIAVLLTFLHTGSWFKPLLVLVLFIIIQQLENNLLVPKIMKKAVGIDPIVSILSLLVGFRLLGVVGAIIAIPFVAILSAIWGEVLALRTREENKQ